MSYFLYPPPDRSNDMEYAYWNGELETKMLRDSVPTSPKRRRSEMTNDFECWNKVFNAIIGTETAPEKKGTAEMDGEFIRYLEEAEAAPMEYYEPCEDPRYYPSDEEIAELNRMSAVQEENDNVFANALENMFTNVIEHCKSAKRMGIFNRSIAEDMIENLSNNIKQM